MIWLFRNIRQGISFRRLKISEQKMAMLYLKQQIKDIGYELVSYTSEPYEKRDFPFRTISGFHAFLLQFVRRKKHRSEVYFLWKSASETVFSIFIYDLISRSSIRRTAAFLSPLFPEILRPDRTRSGRCRICGCFQDRSGWVGSEDR